MATETRFKPSPLLLKLGRRQQPQRRRSRATTSRSGSSTSTPASARAFSEDEVAFLTAIATLIIIAVERDRDEQATRHAALHDPLTGLPNRTLALDRLAHALARRQREGSTSRSSCSTSTGFKLDQRLARPRRRRRGAARAGAAADRRRAPDRHRRAARRRRVRRHLPRRRRAPAGRRESPSGSAPRSTARWCSSSGEHFFTVSIGITLAATEARHARSRCCATPTRRCTGPRTAAAAATSCSTRRCAPAPIARVRIETELRRALDRDELERLLPAGDRPRDRPAGLDRGARALAAPRARPGPAARVHPDRRGDRPDRRARAARPRAGLPPDRGLAAATSTRRSASRSTSPGARRSTRCSPPRWRPSPSAAGCAPARSRSRSPRRVLMEEADSPDDGARHAPGARADARARRLRHRLLVAQPPQALPARRRSRSTARSSPASTATPTTARSSRRRSTWRTPSG